MSDIPALSYIGLAELLVVIEQLYKHTLETLLNDNAEDLHYFHNEIGTKVCARCECAYVSFQFQSSPM